MLIPEIEFAVWENPLPKQSFRVSGKGGYTPRRIKDWQNRLGWEARIAMRGREPLEGPLAVEITFWRKTQRRVDSDNLSKACLDSLNGIAWRDDNQVVDLYLHKRYNRERPGIEVKIMRAAETE